MPVIGIRWMGGAYRSGCLLVKIFFGYILFEGQYTTCRRRTTYPWMVYDQEVIMFSEFFYGEIGEFLQAAFFPRYFHIGVAFRETLAVSQKRGYAPAMSPGNPI